MFSHVGQLGSANEKTADTSLVIGLDAGASVGDLVVVRVVTDNGGTSEGETTLISAADSQGNSYTRAGEYTRTAGGIGDGATTAVLYSVITTALTNSDSITITCTNVVAKAGVADAFSGDSITFNSYGASGGTGTSPSESATGSSGKNCLFVGCVGSEAKPGAYTEESGWTELGSDGPGTGGPASCVACEGGYKTTTGAGETHDPTLGASVDYAHVVACFYEDAASPITGSLSETIAPVTLSGAGELDIDGSLSATIEPITIAAAGELDIEGSLSSTIADITLEATGTLGSEITGSLEQTIDPVTLSANGELGISGTLSEPIGDIELAASGEVAIGGSLSAELDPVTLAGTGELDIDGSLSAQIEPVTLSSTGEVDIAGSLSSQIDPVTISGTAELDIIGALSAQIGPVTLEAEGTSQSVITGALDSSIGEVTLAASGELLNTGTLSTQIDEFGLSAAGEVSIAGALEQTIDPFTLSASGELEIAGSVSAALDPVTLSAVGELDISGSLDAAIGDILLTAAGGVGETADVEVTNYVDLTFHDQTMFNFGDRYTVIGFQHRDQKYSLRDR